MTSINHAEAPERRSAIRRSRRHDDRFQDGGGVILAMGLAAMFAFVFGMVVGAMVW